MIVAFLALVAGFSPKAVLAEQITAFAASSLRDAVGDLAERYTADSGVEVVLVFAASSTIARQIAQGAPADVVLLADQDWADWLVEQGALDDPVAFARNTLVLIGRDGTAEITHASRIEAALGGGVLAMAQVDAVPAGRYGKAALVSSGLWDVLAPRVVQAANVRAALRFVERGEAALGIGYGSDLIALPDLVAVYTFAGDSHPEIIYSGGAITPQGAGLMDYIQTDIGKSVLEDWGFLAVGAP